MWSGQDPGEVDCCTIVLPGIEPNGIVYPSKNNNNILGSLAYCNPSGNWKFLAVRRVSSDDPSRVSCWPSISSHVIRWCVRTSPPPCSRGMVRLFNPRFPGLTLRHRYAVTWTCDRHLGSHPSTPSSTLTSSSSSTSRLEHRVSVFTFFSIVAFFGGLPFAQLFFQSELL